MHGTDRVVIVGTGLVGATTAYALLQAGTAPELVLIDRDPTRVEGHVHDLRDAALFAPTTRIRAGDFHDCADAAVIVIAAGVHQTTTMQSRLDDLREASVIIRSLVTDIAREAPTGTMVLASNPVDVLTYLAWQWSGLPSGRVIGSGTCLDTARFRWRLGERYGVAAENVHAYVIGEHGDSQVAALSSARIGGVPLEEFCGTLNLPYNETALRAIANDTRGAGLQILRAKGATCYGIASALVRIVTAIVRDEHAVLTVSTHVPHDMQLGDVCLSLPAVIAREGVVRVLPLPTNAAEAAALRASAAVLKQHIESVPPTS
jgi:L-lactate dehydrogenase